MVPLYLSFGVSLLDRFQQAIDKVFNDHALGLGAVIYQYAMSKNRMGQCPYILESYV